MNTRCLLDYEIKTVPVVQCINLAHGCSCKVRQDLTRWTDLAKNQKKETKSVYGLLRNNDFGCFDIKEFTWGVGGQEGARPQDHSWGYSFIIEGEVGRERRMPSSFLSGHPASITSSSSRLSRGVLLSLRAQARSTNYCVLCVQRARPRDP